MFPNGSRNQCPHLWVDGSWTQTIFIIPWCWSRCSQMSVIDIEKVGWEAQAVPEQVFLAGSGVPVDPWGYLWPIISAPLLSVYSYHAQNPIPNHYSKMILCTHGLCGLH